ncbi:MAG: potassium-transporting ATPase subunit KdpB, partial [Bacillota bacterium]
MLGAQDARRKRTAWNLGGRLLTVAVKDAFRKLDPRLEMHNPVMFVVEIGALLTTAFTVRDLVGVGAATARLNIQLSLWLWVTVLFGNFAEALAEGRGKAQAAALRRTRSEIMAKKLVQGRVELVPCEQLRRGDVVLVEAGDIIPGDGEVIEGIASVDESAVTGESAPVIRESGGDRSAVTGGTRVLSDWIKVRIASHPGESFLDRMIALVEGARRQKTPNEIALTILLVALTLIFLLVVATLEPLALYAGVAVPVPVLVALLVCLIPTTIGGLLSAISIAGMDRLLRRNVLVTSGRAVEAAGDVDVLLLDKTGTITLGNRMATAFVPAPGVTDAYLADAAQLASLADETPEGRSIVVLAKRQFGLRERDLGGLGARFVPFSAHTRMSGVDVAGREIRKGAPDAIKAFVKERGGSFPPEVEEVVSEIARGGGTPL